MRKRRVLVLLHQELMPPDSIEGMSDEEIHAFKTEFDVVQTLRQLGHRVTALGLRDELRPIRHAIETENPHVTFNLLTDFQGVALYDAHVVSFLELLRMPYTGCNPRGILLSSDKALAKKVLTYHRIRVPAFVLIRRGRKVRLSKRLAFPLFVKSSIEHASAGISQASIVHDLESLSERVQFIHDKIGTDALVEEYIQGREFTVGVIGNQRLQTFPVWEMTFDKLPDGTAPIATARVKWDLKYQAKIGLRTGLAQDIDDRQRREFTRIAKRVYRVLGLSGFARIDFRMSSDGKIYVLEANPNPALSFGEDFAESGEAAGLEYPQLIQRILNMGLNYRPAWQAN